jgi:DNA-damage-inducible protein J
VTENSVVRARVSEKVKTKATKVLAGMGLTVSDAMRMTLTRIARDESINCLYDHEPNAETAEVLRSSLRGVDVHGAKDLEDLRKQLGI